MFESFFIEMERYLPDGARIMMCAFHGDPNDEIYGKWRARVLNDPMMVDESANVYLCVSAMRRNAAGEFRRRKENFAGGLMLMIDDIGDGKGSKWPLSVLDPLKPTALIETSKGNFQAMYFFDRLLTDMEEFDALIRAFIKKKFLDKDTGQAGVNRVFRPPIGINGKAKHAVNGKPWNVRLEEWNPELRYSPWRIAEAFGLDVMVHRPMKVDAGFAAFNRKANTIEFVRVRGVLRAAGMLKREDADYSGWIPITCPWTDHHSDRADSGAAIRLPAEENMWSGAFRCHHGHCQQRNWRALTDWIVEEEADLLEMTNRNAGYFMDYQFKRGALL